MLPATVFRAGKEGIYLFSRKKPVDQITKQASPFIKGDRGGERTAVKPREKAHLPSLEGKPEHGSGSV